MKCLKINEENVRGKVEGLERKALSQQGNVLCLQALASEFTPWDLLGCWRELPSDRCETAHPCTHIITKWNQKVQSERSKDFTLEAPRKATAVFIKIDNMELKGNIYHITKWKPKIFST